MILSKSQSKSNKSLPLVNYAAEIALGNKAAFSAFVREKARYFYAIAYRVVLNSQAAEDVVQNAFAKLWEKRHTIKDDGNISAWMYRVVVNEAIDNKRRLRFINQFAVVDDNIVGVDENSQENDDLNKKIMQVLQDLPPRQRAAVMMVYFDGYGQKEAADFMGVKLKALESLLSRAKIVLKERLA